MRTVEEERERIKNVHTFCVCICGKPLVSTFAFSYAEFYCVDCGKRFGMFDSPTKPVTEELVEQYLEAFEFWQGTGANIIPDRSWQNDCEKCDGRTDEYHLQHASQEEMDKHNLAFKQLKERIDGIRT